MALAKSHFKAALFDMDGVLYDSMPGHVVAYRDALSEYGLEITAEDVYACEGMKGTETIMRVAERQWGREITIDEAKEIYEAKCRIFRELPKAKKIEGVEHLMRYMQSIGMQICVVTGSGQLSLLEKLASDFSGIIDAEHIICSRDYKQGKPSPDPYLMGLERCGVDASEAIVVENAPLGVRAGKAAGIFTIAVNTGPLPRETFVNAGADEVFATMYEAQRWLEGL